jgi:hypothetical protein
MKSLMNRYQIDPDAAELNMIRGIEGYTLIIPLLPRNASKQRFAVGYYNGENQIENIKVMSLETDNEIFKIIFSDYKESINISGVYKNGLYIKTIVENKTDNLTIQKSFQECIEEGFEELPWALQLICAASCAAIWTGAGLAACAGCLAGLGIFCD